MAHAHAHALAQAEAGEVDYAELFTTGEYSGKGGG
jgi:hypothetical protein